MATSEQMIDTELLRLVTAGSVDDGKSTLIGRLLYDTKQILVDQLEHIEETSKRRGDGYVNLALLTDGLRAEREQGITIDVAYRSFVTPRRRFQLADAPGHVQYTRNMVTGASTADLAVILVDARKGVIEQTRRHSYVAAILDIPHVTYALNKMDLVEFSEERFDEVAGELGSSRSGSGCATCTSCRSRRCAATTSSTRPTRCRGTKGRRCSSISRRWRSPPTATRRTGASRCSGSSARWRTSSTTTAATPARSRAGSGASATRCSSCRPGGARKVAAVETADGPLERGDPAAVGDDPARGRHRHRPRRHARGPASAPPVVARELEATLCWMASGRSRPRARVVVKHTTRTARAIVEQLPPSSTSARSRTGCRRSASS